MSKLIGDAWLFAGFLAWVCLAVMSLDVEVISGKLWRFSFKLLHKRSCGRVVGFRCYICGEVRQSMWGEVCNGCREKREQHDELVAALKALGRTAGEPQ